MTQKVAVLRYGFTESKFREKIEYTDLPSSREEAFLNELEYNEESGETLEKVSCFII